ncbi:hypothetical protein ACFYR1_51465 [Streptomyces canus]|uniref:hypothetical protein n=1 Tax=Streptomyces canus TaxID=58343 RepID=UPI0036974DF5
MARFHEPDSGTLLFDDLPATALSRTACRGRIAVVDQNAHVVHGTPPGQHHLRRARRHRGRGAARRRARPTGRGRTAAAGRPVGNARRARRHPVGRSASAWPWPARCSPAPRSSCSTSPPRTSTPSTRPRSPQ